MSTLRNIAAHLWRGSHVRKANVVLGITGVALSAACAAENAVAPDGAPSAQRAQTPVSGHDVAFDVARGAAPAPGPKSTQDAIKQYNKAQMDSMQADWQAYKRGVQAGLVDVDFVRCAPKPAITVKKVIGPKGGTFNVGPNKFEVPAGALDSNVTITATAPTTSRAELQFMPHGLQFNKPVQMTMSYKGCIVPVGAVLGVAYVGHVVDSTDALHGRTKQQMPTRDDKSTSTVSALTDHFSGYMVSWSRGSTSAQ